MAFSLAVTDKIKTFKDLQTRCNLYQAEDENFFTEWIQDLPELSDAEKTEIARIKKNIRLSKIRWVSVGRDDKCTSPI